MEIKLLFILFFSYVNCENELIAINCKENIVKYFQEKSNWHIGNNSDSCPKHVDDILKICIKSFNNPRFNYVKYTDSKSNNSLNENYKIYKCLINENPEALDVPSECEFKHTLNDDNPCFSEEQWKAKAERLCLDNIVRVKTVLVQFRALFKCEISDSKPVITYKSIQYVCCPKLDAYDSYKIHLNDINNTVKSEKRAFELAKKTLLERFKQRQKEIQDRFISEEKSLNNLTQHPKLASFLENKIQYIFQTKFMSEMNNEVNLLKELEIFHENRMQTLFEENRKSAKARLEYTVQETNPQASRITEALKLELQSILSESEDIILFYKTLLKEGLNSERNKILIRENFNSLIMLSWSEVIKILNKVPNLKDEILSNIKNFKLKKEELIKRFKYLDKDYTPPISMKSQAENFVKNMISLYGHGLVENKSTTVKKYEKESIATLIIILLICLSIMFLMAISILLYRFHGKINSYLSNTFKKIHPPNKSLLVQIENYPFKNRYNYGNGIFQPYFKSEESIIGHPNSVYNQHFSSINEAATNDGLKKSLDSDFNESSISNINGLENPICRLLDEK